MPVADHGPTAPFLARIGAELRARRRAAGLTAQELAARAAVSRRMIGQVEQGQANPSLVTVDKLARALGTDFATLAGAGGAEPVAPGAAAVVWRSAAGGRATLHVTSGQVGGPELWEWELAPGDRYAAEPDPPGSEELLLVLGARSRSRWRSAPSPSPPARRPAWRATAPTPTRTAGASPPASPASSRSPVRAGPTD